MAENLKSHPKGPLATYPCVQTVEDSCTDLYTCTMTHKYTYTTTNKEKKLAKK